MTTQQTQPRTPGTASFRRSGVTVLAAVAAALAIWGIATAVLNLALTVELGTAPVTVGAGSVAAASLVSSLAGWAMAALLARLATRARRAWLITAAIALLLSLTGPLFAGATAPATIVLMLMHLVVGAIVMVGLAPR